jgi:tetratricopeptide (TPR) repeat protein
VNLGNLHSGGLTPEKARPYYLEALDLLKPLDDHRALGILYHNLGMDEARHHHWNEAMGHFTAALDSHRIVGNEDGLALTYSQLGKTFFDAGRFREAEKCFNNASEHFIKLGNELGEAAALRYLADVYERLGESASAITCLERVVLIGRHYHSTDVDNDVRRLDKLSSQ